MGEGRREQQVHLVHLQAGPRHKPGDPSHSPEGGPQHLLLPASAQPNTGGSGKPGEKPPKSFKLGTPAPRFIGTPRHLRQASACLHPFMGHADRRRREKIRFWASLLLHLRLEGTWRCPCHLPCSEPSQRRHVYSYGAGPQSPFAQQPLGGPQGGRSFIHSFAHQCIR